AHLCRLQLVRSEPARSPMQAALAILRAAQLVGEDSKLHEGGVAGGPSSAITEFGTLFEEAFAIASIQNGFKVTMTGRGSFRAERCVPTLEAAAREVVAVYTARKAPADHAVAS